MKDSNKIRKGVSESYAKAVSRPAPDICGCGCVPEQKGVVVKKGGYSVKELKSLPEDAVVNSFGCGNPVAMSGLKKGDVVTVRSVIERLCALAGVTPVIEIDQSLVRSDDPVEIRGDATLIRQLVGWQPRIPLEQTLGDLLATL